MRDGGLTRGCPSISLVYKTFSFFQKTSELKISVELEGVEFGAEASFLVGALSVHADVKLASLWTVSSSWPG